MPNATELFRAPQGPRGAWGYADVGLRLRVSAELRQAMHMRRDAVHRRMQSYAESSGGYT